MGLCQVECAKNKGGFVCLLTKDLQREARQYLSAEAWRRSVFWQCCWQNVCHLLGRILPAFCQLSAHTKYGFWEGTTFCFVSFYPLCPFCLPFCPAPNLSAGNKQFWGPPFGTLA